MTTMVTLPASCCYSVSSSRPMAAALRPTHYAHSTSTTTTTPPPPSTTSEYERDISLYSQIFQCPGSEQLRTPYKVGCHDRVAQWIKSRADILFILGFCVISFLKLCFLGILRYEIREMIQKIKILQEKRAEIEAEAAFVKPGPKLYEHNGGVVGVAKQPSLEQVLGSCGPKKDFLGSGGEVDQTRLSPVLVVSEQERGDRPGPVRQQSGNIEIITTAYSTNRKPPSASPNQSYMRRDDEEDEDDSLQNTPLLSHSASSPAAAYSNQSTKSRLQRSFLSTILNHRDYGNDSDSNSHCALLITDDVQQETEEAKEERDRKRKQESYQRSHSNGNNNSYEMKEMNRAHSASASRELSPPSQI